MGMIRVSESVLALLREYSEKTGVPMSAAANEALGEWLATVGDARLVALTLRKPAEVVALRSKKGGK